MKTLFTFLLLAGIISAQTIYKVTPGTNDNKIILTVENSSTDLNMTDIRAFLSKKVPTINFKQTEQEIEKIEKQSSQDVEFTFDVNRVVDANKIDTLKFKITSNSGSWTKEIVIGYELPKDFVLEQNYPNPFNPSTTIEFSLPKEGKYSIRIYNILGQVVKTLADKTFEAGYHKITFDASRTEQGRSLTSGVYFYTLNGTEVNLVKKMMLMK